MVTNADPEGGEGARSSNIGTVEILQVGATVVSPTSPTAKDRIPSVTPTSEHGGRNEPLPPPPPTGTLLPVANLDQWLAETISQPCNANVDNTPITVGVQALLESYQRCNSFKLW